MKYVVVLDVKNATSFLLTQFRGIEMGEMPANESCEGVTFFRATGCEIEEQLAYFSSIHDMLIKQNGRGIDAALIPQANPAYKEDIRLFCAGIRKLSSEIATIYAGEMVDFCAEAMMDYYTGSENQKSAIKSFLKIEPGFDNGVAYPDNPFSSQARKLRAAAMEIQ